MIKIHLHSVAARMADIGGRVDFIEFSK